MSDESSACYEIYAIRYGTNDQRKRGQNFILEQDPTHSLTMDFYCWFLRSSADTIVIDTGMNPKKAEKHGHTMLVDPVHCLSEFGIDPSEIKQVILTHLHYDHTGHLSAYPNARFHLQAEEMNYVTGPWMGRPWFRRAYEVDEICETVALLHSGRLNLHGRDHEILDGVTVHWVGGHCAGQEIVRVRTQRGWVVLASDALHYFEEYERGIPFAVAFNLSDMIAGHERIRELATSDAHVLPAHDPRIKDMYPLASDGSKHVFRIDLAPVS